MFKKAKKKIVISILSILVAVLVGTLVLIYISSYISATNQNYKVLENHVEKMSSISQDGPFNKNNMPFQNELNGQNGNKHRPDSLERNLEVGTFYQVKLGQDGSAFVMENGAEGLYTDDELISIAQSIGDSRGRSGELLYIVTTDNGDSIVWFMDNTVVAESFSRLFLFTLIFGLIAIVAIAFISVNIANRIVAPMEESYQKQKEFTADAGHELKTPIAAVAANVELLQREIGENKWLDSIAYENERMRQLITQLLELARNENQVMERSLCDLSYLVNSAILPLEATAFESNIILESDIEDNLSANVNEHSISQLVTILVDNAISHTVSESDQTSIVNISLSQARGKAILRVTNPGEEIAKAERDRLFERFYRSDSSHEFTGHYGLGLAIAKAIVDTNDGSIRVECQDNKVSFIVELPLK